MVDNRSAGFYGIGGSFNFKSGDISGTAANTQDDKMGPGSEYASLRKDGEEDDEQKPSMYFTDRSAQLRATLNSLAMINVAGVLNSRKKLQKLTDEEKEEIDRQTFLKKKKKEFNLENHFIGDKRNRRKNHLATTYNR